MEHRCLNCDTVLAGNFCPECGQKASTHRITFAAILHDIPHSVLHIDKGFFHTFVQLLYRPGKAIAEYVHGKRVRFFSPFAYLILLCAASTFVRHVAVRDIPNTDPHKFQMLFPEAAQFFMHYPALMLCALTPFLSLVSWVFNVDKGYNYWENFILNMYLMAQFNIFFIINNIVLLVRPETVGRVTPMLLFFNAYVILAYLQFFPRSRGIMPNVIRNTAMFVLIALTLITGLSVTGFMTKWW